MEDLSVRVRSKLNQAIKLLQSNLIFFKKTNECVTKRSLRGKTQRQTQLPIGFIGNQQIYSFLFNQSLFGNP